jgi:hypothetical protein
MSKKFESKIIVRETRYYQGVRKKPLKKEKRTFKKIAIDYRYKKVEVRIKIKGKLKTIIVRKRVVKKWGIKKIYDSGTGRIVNISYYRKNNEGQQDRIREQEIKKFSSFRKKKGAKRFSVNYQIATGRVMKGKRNIIVLEGKSCKAVRMLAYRVTGTLTGFKNALYDVERVALYMLSEKMESTIIKIKKHKKKNVYRRKKIKDSCN